MSLLDDETKQYTNPKKHNHADCEYMKDRNRFFSTNLLKIIGLVYGLASPFFVWLVATSFAQATDIALLKEKQTTIIELKQTIDTMSKTLTQIQIDIGTLKGKP